MTTSGLPPVRRSPCPVACTLDIVGDRWSLLLIRDLLGARRRYGDFVSGPEGIPTNIPAERLKRLERHRLLRRISYSTRPPRAEYKLTPKGRDMGRVVGSLAEWGLRYIPGTTAATIGKPNR